MRALIADDEPLARERLCFLLSAEQEVEVAGECRNGREVIAALKCANDAAGMTEPLDSTAECSVAVVVWVSLWSASVKFIVPVNVCSVVESVVLAISVKLPVAAGAATTLGGHGSRGIRIGCAIVRSTSSCRSG